MRRYRGTFDVFVGEPSLVQKKERLSQSNVGKNVRGGLWVSSVCFWHSEALLEAVVKQALVTRHFG